jgi:hypothetical protein
MTKFMSCLKRNTAEIFAAFVFLSVNACAQTAPSPINTDRPAFADSSVVVPLHSLQIENGFLNTLSSGQQSFDLPETLLRFGLFDKTELRLTVPDYYYDLPASGWSDTVLGVKQQLGPIHGFDVSVVISLSFPTGSRGITSHGYDPSIQLPWSHSLSKNWTAAGMLSVYWPTQGASRNTNGQVTLLFDRQLTMPWDGFVEYVGDFPERGGPQHILHFGTSYKLTLNQQVDFHFGFGLSSAAPTHFIGVGYSILARKIR